MTLLFVATSADDSRNALHGEFAFGACVRFRSPSSQLRAGPGAPVALCGGRCEA